jgi:hypothetical protein
MLAKFIPVKPKTTSSTRRGRWPWFDRTSGFTILSFFEPRHIWVVGFLSKILNTDIAKFGISHELKQFGRKCDAGEEGGGGGGFKNAGDDDGIEEDEEFDE